MVDTKVGFLIEKKAPAKVGLTAPEMELSTLPSTQGLSYQGGDMKTEREKERQVRRFLARVRRKERIREKIRRLTMKLDKV